MATGRDQLRREVGPSLRLASFLRSEREQILQDWEDEDRKTHESASKLPQQDLRDHMPAFLDEIATQADEASMGEHEVQAPSGNPRQHAQHRIQLNFRVQELTKEYALLRKAILSRLAPRVGELGPGELVLLNGFLDEGIIESVDEFSNASSRRLREEKIRLSTILEQLPTAVLIAAAPSCKLVYANRQAAKMFGRPLESSDVPEFLGLARYRPDGSLIGRDDWPLIRTMRTGEVVDQEEMDLELGDGGRGTFTVSSAPIRDEDGAVVSAVLTITDISERKRAEREVRARAELEQQLIGIVSHDLRNPISAIIMAGNVVLNRTQLDDPLREPLRRILSSAERANRMIRDLLDFTRARLGKGIPIDRQEIDLRELVEQVLEEVRISFPDREIVTELQGDCRASLDPDRIAQVVTNLVHNALQYGPADVPVRVTTKGAEHWLELSVWNAGRPIPPALSSHIFEPMQRGTKVKSTRSIGLGLFIVRHIVEAHGGRVDMRSDADDGTTFSVRIPR